MPQTEKQRVGRIGEDVACKYLVKQGFLIVERNFWKKFGEIDIVAKKDGILHFIEVKSVSRNLARASVSHVTVDSYRPEDNLHPYKLKRFGRAIQVYLEQRDVPHETPWQIDAITVLVDETKRVGRVEVLGNIVI